MVIGNVAIASGSTRKISIMCCILYYINIGTLHYDTMITITSRDHVRTALGSGILHYLRAGMVLSVSDLIVLMMILSDNTATGILTRLIPNGIDGLNRYCHRLKCF